METRQLNHLMPNHIKPARNTIAVILDNSFVFPSIRIAARQMRVTEGSISQALSGFIKNPRVGKWERL